MGGVAVFLVLFTVSCAGSDGSGTTVTTGSTTPTVDETSTTGVAAGDPAVLYGTYTASIPAGVNAPPGSWGLTVTPDEVTFTRPDGRSFSPGTLVELTATEIVLGPDPDCPVQEGPATEGRYLWSRDGDTLTLEVVSDSCQDRIDTFTSSTWSVSP